MLHVQIMLLLRRKQLRSKFVHMDRQLIASPPNQTLFQSKFCEMESSCFHMGRMVQPHVERIVSQIHGMDQWHEQVPLLVVAGIFNMAHKAISLINGIFGLVAIQLVSIGTLTEEFVNGNIARNRSWNSSSTVALQLPPHLHQWLQPNGSKPTATKKTSRF